MMGNKMADSDEWFVGEDGCLSVGKPTNGVTYHSTLNTILVATKEPAVKVLDVTSGLVLQSSDLSACRSGSIKCHYLAGRDKMFFTDGYAVGVRKDLNGILLLDTALQRPISRTEDIVSIDLSLPDARHLYKCLMEADLPGLDYVEDVLRELEKEIDRTQQATKGNHKIAKWATVCLKLSHCALKCVFSNLVLELKVKRLHQQVPGLPIASAITDRLTYLLPSHNPDVSSSTVDRSLMYSEAARRLTFMKWPHMNYKWALPEAMAQAGFYHQPSSTGDDRAMCFTCNVCLVCWEPTDEPWSEHERHYPTCPFVKGEYTQNVPMAVSYATDPAILHAGKGSADQVKVECVSTTSSDDYIATSSLHGNIVVWNVACQLKKYIQFNIDPWEPMIAVKTVCPFWKSEDEIPEQSSKESAKEGSTEDECETDSKPVPPEEGINTNESSTEKISEESISDDNKSTAEIIEVTGAWKHSGNKDEMSINDIEPHSRETFQRCRPSQDVLVSALCVLGPPPAPNTQVAAAAASPPPPSEPTLRPCLISGVGIRRNTLSLQGFGEVSSSAGGDPASEVQALNQVNQALSGDSTPQIISGSSSSSQTPSPNPPPVVNMTEKQNPFVPYLLVHDITKPKKGLQPWKSMDKSDKPGSSSSGGTSNSGTTSYTGTKMSQMIAPGQECFYTPIMEIEEEDPDVQILGFPLSLTDNMIKYSGAPSLVPAKSNNNNNLSDSGHTSAVVGSTKSISSSASTKEFTSNITVENTTPQFPVRKEGRMAQCIELPPQVTPDQYVSSITPTVDSRHVVVVTAPKCLHQNISSVDSTSVSSPSPGSQQSGGSSNNNHQIPSSDITPDNISTGSNPPPPTVNMDCTESPNTEESTGENSVSMCDQMTGAGGCLIIYPVVEDSNDLVLLDYTPRYTNVIDNIDDTITSVLMLPKEICQAVEEEDLGGGMSPSDGQGGGGWEEGSETGQLDGQIAVTTHRGDIKILQLTDCKTLATIPAPHRDKFVSVTYCTGMDRLCACTKEGKLHFYVISPHGGASQELESDLQGQMSPVRGGSSGGLSSREEPMDTNIDHLNHEDLLVHQPLTTEVLLLIHELTQFENLMPRFSATVPPCWTEIQQEQQQRRHPQHLQQQGENMQHTRTWRLLSDSSSYDEHLFELVLPRTCSLGHIDVKFQLHPMCTSAPIIQVTLLKQNISNIGRQPNPNTTASSTDVDSKIDFIKDLSGQSSPADKPFSFTASSPSSPFAATSPSGSPGQQASVINNVLDPQFLKRYSAEILCGPVDLASHVDLSGHSGVISLTSPQLLKVKSRSFLVHIKALSTGKDEEERLVGGAAPSSNNNKKNSRSGSASPNNPVPTTSLAAAAAAGTGGSSKDKAGLKCLLNGSGAGSKTKLENIKGCDWLQEISVTVRRCKRSKKTTMPRDRLQRLAIVENVPFHEQLLVAACGQDEKLSASTSVEHRQGLALDTLAWVAALQMNDPTHRIEQSCIVLTVQSNLKGLLKACFIEGGRSSAHKCAKFISLCIEFSKNIPDPNLAPAFNYALLCGLLDCVPLLPSVNSAGALHWYFTLLNRVKCMDIAGTGQKCADMLAQVSRHYHDRTNPLHSLLKARFGLYGAPLDPILFDIGPPQFVKPGSSNTNTTTTTSTNNNTTTATGSIFGMNTSVAGNNNTTTSSATVGTGSGMVDEIDIRDLLSINSPEKAGSKSAMSHIQHHICGLLEVEPLHFTCHATSDGTRMERMDAGNSGTTVSSTNTGLPGTINFGEAIPSVSAAGAALASLSTAMASAEQQLQLLQQKQLHLAKLQQQKQKLEQKLAENKQAISTGSPATTSIASSSGYVPYTSELLPPTPKTTPLFNTPPVTPPNESYLYHPLQEASDPGKPPVWKPMGLPGTTSKIGGLKVDGSQQKLPLPQTQHLLQAPPPQVLVIERMPSGARRFVVLDFGKPVLLTDIIVPACGDLASLSIDTWVQGEEIDGQRLVVSTDIGIRSLIMNDLMPSPVCRYLKITTIGRYSGGTTRSRIPIGSFYGHTTILPWECDVTQLPSLTDIPPNSVNPLALDQSHILSQLAMFVALQEDIQCRYSLTCNRLTSLLNAIDMPHSNNNHTKYYLKKTKKSEEDLKIQQAYYDCMQLQLQLNLAQRAIARLQRALGIPDPIPVPGHSVQVQLKQASTDKLRCLAEQLLDTLLSMTYSTPTIPQLPSSLYTTFTPVMAESIFRHLCVNGTRRMQIHAGVLLVRLCGNQNWWGDFLGSVLQDYFASEQPDVFPQDRVFLLVTALGQKSLGGSSASDVLESILSLLARLLAPLLTGGPQTYTHNSASLDLCLIGWLLLFLSRNLDSTSVSSNLGDDEKNSKENQGSSSSRWDFIQGESAMQNSRLSNRTTSSKLYRRKLQKRLMHHKQQLMDIQAAKKTFLTSQMDKATLNLTKEVEALMKQQEQLFKKQLKQYSSKHFKDIMQIRRTDGELLKKLPKDSSNGAGPDSAEVDSDLHITVVREKVIPVVRGLVALLLSMDFTCNVDLFLITCKVVARLTNVTRPAVILSEVMSQEELEHLMLLCCNLEYNHGNISWGGAWAAHSITCLLQDILDGERLYPASQSYSEGVTDDDMSSNSMDAESSLPSTSTTAPTMDTDQPNNPDTSGAEAMVKDEAFKFDKESSLIVDMILDEDEYDEETNAKLQEYIMVDVMLKPMAASDKATVSYNYNNQNNAGKAPGTVFWGAAAVNSEQEDKKQKFELWKNKLATIVASKANVVPQGISTAMDSRLENSLQLTAELRLKVMVSLETESVQSAISAPLPPPPVPGLLHNFTQQSIPTTDDDQLTDAHLLSHSTPAPIIVPSHEMLSVCFNNLFAQLSLQRVNVDALLTAYLTLNDDASQDDASQTTFYPSKAPSIALSPQSVTSLLATLAWSPNVPVRTWVLSFQVLSILANLKCPSNSSSAAASSSSSAAASAGSATSTATTDKWLATVMVADSNMMAVLIKFLSGTSLHGPVISSHQYTQVGPTAVRAFQELLSRLQLRCTEDSKKHLKELMLKLIYTLATERGAFHSGLGPLDAQCKLLEHLLDQTYDHVDVSNAISVIDSLSVLVHQHILGQEKVVCRSSSENSISARSCFCGLFTSVLRPNDSRTVVGDANRDVLMCHLLKLVNMLIQVHLTGRSSGPGGGGGGGGGGANRRPTTTTTTTYTDLSADLSAAECLGEDSPMTDTNKLNQSLASSRVTSPTEAPKSDDEKGAETDEQKSETAASAQIKKVRSCSHFADVLNPEAEHKEPCLADVVLSHPQIMRHLLQALSCCKSNAMAMLLGSSGLQGNLQEAFTGIDPLSVGDGIFQILCTLNKKATDVSLVLKPMLEYLASGFHGMRQAGICRLSEPLLWFILTVLDCGWSIRAFLGMNGIEVICANLVQSNRRVINVSPSLVSTIMQYLGNSKSSSSATKRLVDTDANDGLQNFAPLGTISSTSPTAGPADVLLQASPPHRRARSAAWSYHFYPDEAWVDLTITLPCAVQLKEIHIQPHLTSLATCPAAVSVEVSRDGTMMMPICAPKITSGLTFIKIHLLKSEVVTAVTIRLHKPRDSTTIGLSQIMLLGSTAFGDTGTLRTSNVFVPTEDYVSRTCIGWLRLLHHCLTQVKSISDEVAAAAARTHNLMVTCTALLVSPSATLYATSIEAVILKIGLHSTDMGLALISNLLRNANLSHQDAGSSLPLHGKVNGIANESTIDILYQLGMTQDSGTPYRIKALMAWLEDSARLALQRARSAHQDSGYNSFSRRHSAPDLPAPAPAHIYCIAAIFWASQELAVTYNWQELVTESLLSELYNWSTMLTVDSALKKAVDTVICSLCYIQPRFFKTLLEWIGVPTHLDFGSANLALGMAMTDDHKDSVHYRHPEPNRESMTDDSKEASNNAMSESGVALDIGAMDSTLNSNGLTLSQLCLDEPRLLTLAMACQSPQALQMLLNSGLPMILCQGLFEFCTREMIRHNSTVASASMEGMTDACKCAGGVGTDGGAGGGGGGGQDEESNESTTQPMAESHTNSNDTGLVITADLVAPVLKFLAEVSKECVMKEWLGSPEGCVFWPALLHLLCNTPVQAAPQLSEHTVNNRKHKMMTSQQRACIETVTVNFFTNVISCHSENQHLFANVLCDVIRGQGATSEGVSFGTCALSGFTRRLFLQVLLEDEKVLVSFRSSSQLYKGPTSSLSTLIQHPRCGAGHKYRAMQVSLHSTCEEVLSKVIDAPSFTQLLDEKNADRKSSDDKKDTSELGLEVVDQISAAAGLQAKEKREKKSQSTPPRPPSRRGHRLPDISSPLHALSLSLYHNMLPGQPMPSDLTLSQLLVLLTERGLQPGQAMLDFTIKLRTKRINAKGDKRFKTDDEVLLEGEDPDVEIIPDEVLLDTPSFPSSLQVFASVGGLALLAEHLPLLYPEVTRQASPPTVPNENNNVSGLGSDWVTVESTEDIYEEIYEPMPPSQPSQSSKQASQVLPTIPPHSLVAFGLFLRLPGYAEVLLKERKRAQCLLRLVLGVTDDGEGGHILTSPIACALPTLPFHVLKSLFDSTPLTTDDGVLLRRMALEIGAVHLVLACLSVLSHHAPRAPIPGFHQEAACTLATTSTKAGEDKAHSYWAKGTGFGTGSTTSSWDAEQAFIRQRSEEEHVTCLLQVLSSYVNPGGHVHLEEESLEPLVGEDGHTTENNSLPAILPELLSQSCLVPAISSYLRNDSVLDMARHVPLYRGLLELLRAMAMCHLLVPLLLPLSGDDESASSVGHLLDKMKTCVDTYASRLKTNKSKSNCGPSSKNKQEEEETEGLALLIPDIQHTACIVHASTSRMRERHSVDTLDTAETETQGAAKSDHSQEERYIEIMRPLQFDTYEMVADEEAGLRFTLSHHYESNVKAAGEVNNAARARRLAQEAVTLSTSLPLSHSSSVFVRCDEDRLDVMKVLITGPSDTPYANGCFEFDVYFPQDYPNSPPLINLETTGNHTVRFNPNLYNDGKVCLSVLNTWHGRPEEKWNPQTSSFLQVLVSIQSLILVSEPYFNEPGYERSRGTASGTASSREYDANIRQATVKWAMLEQLRNPSACFRDVIERHFWLKKNEIMTQVEEWISELEAGSSDKRTGRTISHSCVALRRHYNQLKDELNKMKSPDGLLCGGGDEDTDNTDTSHSLGAENMDTLPQSCTDSEEADLSKKSPTTSTDSTSNLEKNMLDEATGQQQQHQQQHQQAGGSKDLSPASTTGGMPTGMILMNHMENSMETMVNDLMEGVETSMMNSMFDSSAYNSLDIDDDLPLYHL